MAKRKAVSKKVRFEVFKRDSFKCQYCGKSAPDVILNADHINPVSKGGDNDIMNLITSCDACNNGKRDTPLSDDAALSKARKQVEELQSRREQIEMMLQWREGLKTLKEDVLDEVCDYWSDLAPGFSINDFGRKPIKSLLRKYGVQEVMEAMDIASENYLRFENGKPTHESVEFALQKVGGVCRINKMKRENPGLAELYYIRAIGRKRLPYFNDWRGMELLRDASEAGVPNEELKKIACTCSSWTDFQFEVRRAMDLKLSTFN